MISTMNQSPRGFAASSSILRYLGVALLAASTIIAQSKIVRPSGQSNSNSGKRPHVATLHSTDSSEGSRVAITSDQSLNDYEAYRRGDRFYVKIPAADVPRAEAVRGRGFADVKSQRTGDSTLLSFRLQPGSTAHVEQRGNKLDVVVAVAGGTPSVASNRPRDLTRPGNGDSRGNANTNKRSTASTSGNKNAAGRDNSPAKASPNNANTRSKPDNTNSSTGSTAKATPTPAVTPSPMASPTAKASPTPAQKSSIAASNSPVPSPSTVAAGPHEDFWTRMKERAHYWLLLAQLNPIPVAAGTLSLLLIIALLLMQRRRAKSTRRVRSATMSKAAATTATSEAVTTKESSIPVAAVAAATGAAVVSSAAETSENKEDKYETTPVISAPTPVVAAADDGRRERVNRVADEAKKVFSGDAYDESLIGSDDKETRRLVGAELLSALVGRNPERRERARDAFMKHGYFDDATRDLRVAESDNERAAAARRLSFVHDREATPHLIGALGDSSPDVRRASVEALMDLRDPAAIGPLNALMQSETDRKVPRPLIKHAIDACATASEDTSVHVSDAASAPLPPTTPPSLETDREVIEI